MDVVIFILTRNSPEVKIIENGKNISTNPVKASQPESTLKKNQLLIINLAPAAWEKPPKIENFLNIQ